MECLNGLIGLRCAAAGPDSGVSAYIDDLPGISLGRAVMSADETIYTGEELLRRSIATACSIVGMDFKQRLLAGNLRMQQIVNQEFFGDLGDGYMTATSWLGFRLSMDVCDDPYVEGYLDHFTMKVSTDASSVSLRIWVDDVETASNVDLTQGVNRIEVQRSFIDSIYVLIDVNGLDVGDGTQTFTNTLQDCGYCCDSCNCVDIQGLSWDGVGCAADSIPATCGFTNSTTLNGFVVSAHCRGSQTQVVCQLADQLVLPLWYRAGALVMEELMSSNRANPYVRNSKEEAQSLFIRWMGGLDGRTGYEVEGDYNRYLSLAVQSSIETLNNSGSMAFTSASVGLADSVRPLKRPRRDLAERYLYNKRNL